jgi:hypothetical protein
MEWIGLIWFMMGTSGGSCEHCIELSGSIKCWKILEGLDSWRLLKAGSAPLVRSKYFFAIYHLVL